MKLKKPKWGHIFILVFLGVLPTIFLLGIYWVNGSTITLNTASGIFLFSLAVPMTALLSKPVRTPSGLWILPWEGFVILVFGITGGIFLFATERAFFAWILLASFFILLLNLEAPIRCSRGNIAGYVIVGSLATLAGAAPVFLSQVETHFAEEEFFTLLNIPILVVFWLLIRLLHRLIASSFQAFNKKGIQVSSSLIISSLIILVGLGFWRTLTRYQSSFYPIQSPPYQGITEESPFLCGQIDTSTEEYLAGDVYKHMLEKIESNPNKRPLELAALALGTGQLKWAEAFQRELLKEAVRGEFTKPANSIKFIQFEAAARAYYYTRVLETFPAVFSPDERKRIEDWFDAVNQRALTVEFVDLMYGLAYDKVPKGPYENQENGTGLLAILEEQGLVNEQLSAQNQLFLNENLSGWLNRFRNSDDAILYQMDWIQSAYLQALYSEEVNERNLQHAFEWLLYQALPDGAPVGYNHPYAPSLAQISNLGARLLMDPRFVWLTGRSLDYLDAEDQPLLVRVGIEESVPLDGYAPTEGSCLIYGNSGLPNQTGPLGPDKIVFRSGWKEDSTYLLLNLRFTGWHRYKATNAIVLIYQKSPLIVEQSFGKPIGWLPEGRSQFRDKRIPRENLNGLLIERQGMDAVVNKLTGIGSPWAQDPPHFAKITHLRLNEGLDVSTTTLENWHGWRHERTISFYHNGPIIVFDSAEGPQIRQAALAWHLSGKARLESENRITIRAGENPAEMLFFQLTPGDLNLDYNEISASQITNLFFSSSTKGKLKTAAVFLTGTWSGATVTLNQEGEKWFIRIAKGDAELEIPLVHHEG